MSGSISQWYSGKTVLVTGGTSGIGLDMARLLVAWGSRVVICGQDEPRLSAALQQLNGIRAGAASGFRINLADSQQRTEFLRQLMSQEKIDVLVNNAGFGYMGEFSSMPLSTVASMEAVNILALVELCQAVIPSMKERRAGGILNVGSVASFFPTPGSAFYGATKYFVRSFTDALHAELGPQGIHVTGLYPGKTMTRFLTRATSGKAEQWQTGMGPEAVARVGLLGLAQNQLRVIPGWMNQAMVIAARFLPTKWLLAATGQRLSSENK